MGRTSPKHSPEGRLLAGLAAFKLDTALADPLLAYLAELARWNEAYNLTSVRDAAEMVTRHILDSLAVLPFVSDPRLLDAGSGAGLPGIPLAVARSDLRATLLDSGRKKARFLRHVQRTLSLGSVEVIEARAEDFRPPAPFAQVISRAFASLGEFLGATAHLAAPDGQWLAMKGKLDEQELRDIPPEFRIVETKRLAVPGLDEERHLVIVSRAPIP